MVISTCTHLPIKGYIVLLDKWSDVFIQPPLAPHSFQWVESLLGTSGAMAGDKVNGIFLTWNSWGWGRGRERALSGTIFKTIYFFLHRLFAPTPSLFRKWICWSYKNMGSI